MNINEKLISVVTQVISICVPSYYEGDSDTYAEFEVDTAPDWYSDGEPKALRYDVLLRYYAQLECNIMAERSRLAALLTGAGFIIQDIEDASDDLSQCYEYYLKYWSTAKPPEV